MIRKVGLAILIATTVCSTFLKAQDNSGTDRIIYSNGSEEYGIIDMTDLNEKGIIYFSTDTEKKEIIYPSQIKEIAVKDNRVIIGKSVKYLNGDNENRVDDYFAETVIQGSVSLFKVFGTPFDYALESMNGVEALQVTKKGDVVNESYKGVFYLAFTECNNKINTSEIKNSRKDFITAVNKYNACLSDDYADQGVEILKNRIYELETFIGFQRGSIDFFSLQTVEFNSLAEPEPDYISQYKVSKTTNFGISLKTNVMKPNFFIGLKVMSNEFKWEHREVEKIVSAPTINLKELIISPFFEARYQFKNIKPAITFSYNIHQIEGSEGGAIVIEREKIERPSYILYFPLKETGKLSSSYTTFSVSPSLFFSLTNQLDIGASYNFFSKKEEFFSHDIDETDDEFKMSVLLLHLRFQKIIKR